MKTFISFATILLAASPVIASPVSTAVNGILTGTPSLPRGLHEAQENARGVVVERAGKL